MIADTLYCLIKLRKKVCVPRLRKKEVESPENGDEENIYIKKVDIDLQSRA